MGVIFTNTPDDIPYSMDDPEETRVISDSEVVDIEIIEKRIYIIVTIDDKSIRLDVTDALSLMLGNNLNTRS